jgi:MYXO-CTERM domain-containing protein
MNDTAPRKSPLIRCLVALVAGAAVLAGSLAPRPVLAAEPPECLLPDPSKWPAPAKPYFMVAFDTSGSMASAISPASNNSCGYPNTRTGHGSCAVKNTFMAYSGQANFGLASYARKMSGCAAGCYTGCTYANLPNNSQPAACASGGCGPEPNATANSSTRAGANILVPMLNDTTVPPPASNVPALISWVDNDCTNSTELFADGCTPLNGILRDMYRYYSVGWTYPGNATVTFPSPLTSVALGERACRSVNVILVTDGDETCDNQADAVAASAALYAGFSKNGLTWNVKTYVINFAGGSQANTDAIAAAGGTTASYFATNEQQLALALSNIIGGSIKPETCDNLDNNCNGCTDEGFTHYCDVQPVAGSCCTANTPAQRTACLTSYQASITAANPQGNLALLPCTSSVQQADPLAWLCYDPGEKCDNVDNNCSAGADEGITKCGSPLHCPQAETCNGVDDNCDGLIDEGNVCPNACVPSAEVCDGCDNDCNGVTDNGILPIPCGIVDPLAPWCAGTITCKTPQNVAVGACAPGGGFNACNNSPKVETCNNVDDNCNGIVDDGIPSVPCVPAGAPAGLNYGPTSTCKMGTTTCTNGATVCVGWVGPSSEICDGLDNDCNGTVDNGVPGTGLQCGVNQLPCTPGLSACVNGTLVCQGGVQPQPEVCNGIDDNCNGAVDEAPLADAPPPGMNGCWTLPGNCCTFKNLSWCPPPGGSCNDNGSLTPPCNKGSLACSGAAGWICQNPKNPAPETCDGIDNNCNGAIDDGPLPQVGTACGTSVGECKPGTLGCTAGILDCVGDVPPSPELCDGKDNDCDGTIDNGIPAGAPCDIAYDTVAFPGDRSFPPCQKGVLQCNGLGGTTCVGGVGPSKEVCDGVDNDCDGKIDESGPMSGVGPDSIDGTDNPLPPPAAKIGDACGAMGGTCQQGVYACVNGTFTCLGSQTAVPETCDCTDNDCDGVIDNPNAPGGPPLCGTGKDCVKSSGGSCQCAQPCGTGEFMCPPGQKCDQVTSSQTGQSLPNGYCVTDPQAACGDCTVKTVKDANDKVICAPAGTTLANCVTPPVCTCKGQDGCEDPCAGVTCGAGTVCTSFGPKAGTCVADNCWNLPCQGCGKACNLGACVDDTCLPDTCPKGQECKPNATFTDHTCVPSCAGVVCDAGKVCDDGVCVADCSPACPASQFCDRTQMPPVCVTNQCTPTTCTNGSCCNPVTGGCGNCPCAGIVCPEGQACVEATGECGAGMVSTTTSTGAGGSMPTTTSTGATGATTGTGSTGVGGAGGSRGVFGLATGGGGCSCEVGPRPSENPAGRWALGALVLGLVEARRRRRTASASRAKEVA